MNKSPLKSLLKPFEKALPGKSFGQLVLTLGLYILFFAGMIFLLEAGVSYWIILLLSILTAGLHVKIFIIMHDCGHQSYFRTTRANNITGRLCGWITYTPYYDWRHAHAIHHATVANLEKRGIGDIWTMTVEEYQNAGPWTKGIYRLFRNPLFLFTIAPIFQFFVLSRFPHKNTSRKDLFSILLTDLSLAVVFLVFHFTLGIQTYLMVLLPVMLIASSFGVWLFFVQHQFEEVYWARDKDWELEMAAMAGSSYYKLPAVLRWFSGNIGFHHIHHLSSKIPNYNLKKCYDRIPALQKVKPINFRYSLKSLFLNLWDEHTGKMVNARSLRG